jgi:hypothetical protein
MPKGHQRSNREAKKPKQAKKPDAPPVSSARLPPPRKAP